jgi:signal transduction histidine kinase
MGPKSKFDPHRFSRRYSAALSKQLPLAESLGREALAAGLDRLDVVRIHEQALVALPPRGDGGPRRAAGFLARALTPIGKAHQTARSPKGELATVQRELKREIGRREAAQEALQRSEQHYRQLLEKSRHMQEHLRRLSHEILSTQEHERKRISRELHDEIGQTLTAVNVKLATLKKEATVNLGDLKKKIASTQRLIEKSMKTVHRFARELRPPLLDDLGLIPALHAYMKAFTKRTSIPIHLKAFAAIEQLDGEKRTVLYRVAQEALVNIDKHAEASRVEASIERVRGVVRMEIRDDGKSFDVQRVLHARKIRRLGLLGMRERVEMVGGSFAVESTPGKGTTIRAQIPTRDGNIP